VFNKLLNAHHCLALHQLFMTAFALLKCKIYKHLLWVNWLILEQRPSWWPRSINH